MMTEHNATAGNASNLPSVWTSVPLEQIAAPIAHAITDGPFGSNLKTSHYTETGPRVIRLQNIGDGTFSDEKAHITDERYALLRKHAVSPGDIVIALLGEILPRACVVPEWLGKAIVKADCLKLVPDTEIADPRFVVAALNSQLVRYPASKLIKGIGRPRLNVRQVRHLTLPLAPRPEQSRIADRLDELFTDLAAGVSALERVRAKLKRYRSAVLHAAVTGRMTAKWRAQHGPSKETGDQLLQRILIERRRQWEARTLAKYEQDGRKPPKNWRERYVEPAMPKTDDLPELPADWCWGTLDQLADVTGGVAKNMKEAGRPGMREVAYLRVANVQRGYLDLAELKTISATESDIANLRLVKGDVLFTEGGDRDKLGRGWIWSGDVEECIHQNHIFRARLYPQDFQPELFSHAGNSYGQVWFQRNGKQSVNLASISLGVLRQFPVPVIPSDEQLVIVEAVQEKLSQIEAMEAEVDRGLARARRLRQATLKAAFAGKLVPQDPKDEPAIVLLERIKSERLKAAAASNGRPKKPAAKHRGGNAAATAAIKISKRKTSRSDKTRKSSASRTVKRKFR